VAQVCRQADVDVVAVRGVIGDLLRRDLEVAQRPRGTRAVADADLAGRLGPGGARRTEAERTRGGAGQEPDGDPAARPRGEHARQVVEAVAVHAASRSLAWVSA
jgi:hypothetical protein